jgi:hypothetical protein
MCTIFTASAKNAAKRPRKTTSAVSHSDEKQNLGCPWTALFYAFWQIFLLLASNEVDIHFLLQHTASTHSPHG